jgi:hypothetical protein
MLNLKILIGSTRPGRAADRVIPWITGAAREHDDFTVEVLDLRDWPLPMFSETFATLGDPATPRSPCQPRCPRCGACAVSRSSYQDRVPDERVAVGHQVRCGEGQPRAPVGGWCSQAEVGEGRLE